MEKIKICRTGVWYDGSDHTLYDTYVGFTGFPSTWPFMTKWIKDKEALTEEQLMKYMRCHLTTLGTVKVIVEDAPK